MYRKKILICLNGKDDAQLEMDYIQHKLSQLHHQIIKIYLENISVADLEESYVHHAALVNASKKADPLLSKLLKNQKKTGAYENQGKNKRQSIYSSSIKELITESLYADLMIIRHTNYFADCSYYGQQKPIYDVLKKSGCPVLVIPDQLCEIQQIVLIYDGTPASLSAIKLLNMILAPICRNLPITVLISCNKDTSPLTANEEKMLIEYLRLHFKDLGVHKICEESAHTIHFALEPQKKALIVNNNSSNALPATIQEEIEKLKLAQSNNYFLFQTNISFKA